jgi:hypothetical protein
MKSFGKLIMPILFLGLLASCGKDNESGKNNPYAFNNPLLNGVSPLGPVTSPYSYGGASVNQVLSENPCISGFGNYPGNGSYGGQRIPIQVPLVNFPTVIAPNDIYVGVTSYGDVGLLRGTAAGQPPMFEAYLCPRSFSPTGQGQLMGIKIGAYSNCLFKPITAATVMLPGGATADFRMLDYGSSARRPFTFCRQQ